MGGSERGFSSERSGLTGDDLAACVTSPASHNGSIEISSAPFERPLFREFISPAKKRCLIKFTSVFEEPLCVIVVMQPF